MAQRISHGQRRGPGAWSTARRSTPCASSSTRRQLAARGSASTRWPQAVANGNVNLPTGVLYGHTPGLHGPGQRPAHQRRRLPAADRGLPQRRAGAAGGARAGSSTASRTTRWPPGTSTDASSASIVLAIQRQPGTNTVEVADAVKALLPTFREQLPASVSLHILYDRSESDPRLGRRREVHAAADPGPGGPGDLPVPAEPLGHASSPAWRCRCPSSGTFAVMYLLDYSLDNLSLMALTLSVGFVVDDAIVMLENIVRHMEMGKRADAGRPGRLARDRLHHRLDDPVAGGGVHPGAVHGRHRRPAVPRVRRDDRRGGPGLGLRLADPDADAVQPFLGHAAARCGTAGSTAVSEAVFNAMRAYVQLDACAGCCGTGWASSCCLAGRPGGHRATCS